ncbi:homeotic protein spalt-major-like isoform X3 [Zerene cesonia]|uniref:homeotic protein spalt-major-like isoform X3 n=1 Tax=Zerene cesonia TaxID=33412 RepID=UPI0018E4FDEF|nr:homeotic protein spalt-major-like isoform X3 [Zerene cesonia]XP_038208702.1 homeotic protein spalt-major-like isoform X3 [Zerene cesonia]
MPRVKPACVRRVSIGESSGSCSEEEIHNVLPEDGRDRPETHMCPRCQEQFDNFDDFLYHKRLCDEKAIQMGEERMHSDPEDMVVSGDEEMDSPNKRLEQVRRHRQDAENNNSLEDGEAEVPEADVPPVGLPFSVAGHVTLEALQNTKVAVAQFAATAMANNANNEAALHELAVLQSTLFTLQHQQVFQLQLIRQLQNQLSLTRRKDDQQPSPPPCEQEPTAPSTPVRSPSPPRPPREPSPVEPAPPTSQSLPSTHSHITPKMEPISIPKPPTSSPPMMSHPPYSSISSSLASSIITNNDPPPSLNEPNTLEMLQKRAQEVLDNASQGLLANNLADELAFRKSGKMSPYDGKSGGRNEPFFKHRCRYCGKVFGSDSALQIHIRSHTGERPFKCNVCGSRFTTKGNLKVHFQRHTAKFPHVKMNPNPVPEHLDKYHPPLLAQLSPGPIPGMPPHPLQFPPGAPAPFPPSLPLYRPTHHDLLPPRPLGDKPLPPHPLFAMREEQDAPADLSKPSAPSPSRSTSEMFKSEPQDEESQRDSSFEETDRISPKREPEENEPVQDTEQERYPSTSPYDDCSMDSKYSNEDQIGRESPHVKPDPDQPENLSSSESGRSARASPPSPSPSPSALSTPPRLPHHSPLPSPPTPLAALGALGGSPFSPLGLAFPPAVRGNTTCTICYKTFACNSALEIHYRSHTKERPFKCTVCDRGFSTKGNMKQHMLTHKIRDMPPGFDKNGSGPTGAASEDGREPSPERRSSPDKMDLKRSPPAHPPPPMNHPPPIDMPPLPKRLTVPSAPVHPPPSASSKHLCGVCRKNFSSSSALQIHMRTHTGDKPFRCAVCQKAFTTKGNLKVHMGTHMWSGGASRRGRRMSLELPPRPLHEPHDLLRRPDLFYPYLPAPFLNGMQQKLNEISVIQQSAGQNGVAGKFPGLLGFGAFGAGRPGAASPLERPPSLENDERQAAMRELAERGRELAERSRQMREESEHYRSPPAHAPHPPPPAQPSPPAPHHPHSHPLASLPPPARTEGLTV